LANILVDTGVWYAIFDKNDHPHERVEIDKLADYIQSMNAIIPWPVIYETVCTRFAKNKIALTGFEKILKSARVSIIDDAPFRQSALDHSFNSSIRRQRPLSFTDCLLRVMIDSSDMRISSFATFNAGDFSDICYGRGVDIIPSQY